MTTVKQYRYAKLLSENGRMTKGEAALKAGYSEAMSKKPSVIERSTGYQTIAETISNRITEHTIAQKVADSIEGMDKKASVLEYLKFAATLTGVLKDRSDVADKQETLVAIKWL